MKHFSDLLHGHIWHSLCILIIKHFIKQQKAGENHEQQATKLSWQHEPFIYFLSYSGRVIDGWISKRRCTLHDCIDHLVMATAMHQDGSEGH